MSTKRVLTGGERSATQGNRVSRYRLRVTNPDGAWLNLGALTVNGTLPKNFNNAASIAKHIDENTLQMSATVRREIGSLSLSPLKVDSRLNAGSDFTFRPAIDLRRLWIIEVSVLPQGVPVTSDSYRPLAEGIITRLDINGEIDTGTITLAGRGMETPILLREQLTEQQYPGAPILERLQAMLDRWNTGATAVAGPLAPSYFVNGTTADSPQPVGPLMPALTEISALPGAVFRYMYDSADVNQLMLFTPDRNPNVADWVLGPREYKAIPLAALDLDSVSNYVQLTYFDEDLQQEVTITSPAPEPTTVSATAGAATFSASPGDTIADGATIVVAGVPYTVSGYSGGTTATLSGAPTFTAQEWVTSASITRYDLKPFVITLAQATNVTTFAAASALVDAIRADLEFPAVEWQIETEGGWFFELYDYVQLLPNPTHNSESQYGGVTAVTHNFAGGKLMTTIGLRGKPAGGYRSWLSFGSNAPRIAPAPEVKQLDATMVEQFIEPLQNYTKGVNAVATVNQYTRSGKFELSTTLDFAVVLSEGAADVANSTAEFNWFGSGLIDPATAYYVRFTPYSGALSAPWPGGAPTGIAGKFSVANTSTILKAVDSGTIRAKLDTPGELAFELIDVPPDVLPPEVVGAGGAVRRVSIFECPSNVEEYWTTIPAALTEVATELRRRADLTGATSARIVATITEAAVTFDCKVAVAIMPVGGSPVDITTQLRLYTAGAVASDWFPVDSSLATDVIFIVKTVGGDDTTSAALSSLAVEASVTNYTPPPTDLGGYTDPFSPGTGPLDTPWIPFSNPGTDVRTVNWVTDSSDGAGTVTLGMSPNSILTLRGYYREDVPSDLVWTIEQTFDASGSSALSGGGLLLYEASAGKFLQFGEFGANALELRTQADALVGSSVVLVDWTAASLRMRRNGPDLEFSYDVGSGWVTYGSFAIATYFDATPAPTTHRYGFFNRNWTFSLTTLHGAWTRTE